MSSFPQVPGGGARSGSAIWNNEQQQKLEKHFEGRCGSRTSRLNTQVSKRPTPATAPALAGLEEWGAWRLRACIGGVGVPEVAGLLQVPLQSPAPDLPGLASDPLTHTASIRVTFTPRPFRELLLPLRCRNTEPGMSLWTRTTLTPGLY